MGAEECAVVSLGNRGRASIVEYVSSANDLSQALHRSKQTAGLFFEITTSCNLVDYLGGTLMTRKDMDIPSELTQPIVDFHGAINLQALRDMSGEQIKAKAEELADLNQELADGVYALMES